METLKVMTVDKPNIIELIKTISSCADAMKLAMRFGKKEHKQVYLELNIDKGHWSRIMSGHAVLSPDLWPLFCDIVDNDILLHWLVYQRGYELRYIPKVLEEQLNEKEEENKYLRARLEFMEIALEKLGKGIQITAKKNEEKSQENKEK